MPRGPRRTYRLRSRTTTGNPYRTRQSARTRNPGTNINNLVRVDGLGELVDTGAVENLGPQAATSIMPSGRNVRSSNGEVTYDGITNGQRHGVHAVISRQMIRQGSAASYNFPFFTRRTGYLIVRGHLLARVLGGSGSNARNLVPLYHGYNNVPMYRHIERRIQMYVQRGNVAEVHIAPDYLHAPPDPRSLFPNYIEVTARDYYSGRKILPTGTVRFPTRF